MENIDIDALATAIAAKIRPPVPIEVALWGVMDIAEYLGVSRSQVSNRFLPLPGFPSAIRIPTSDGHRSHPRWRAIEVIEWAGKFRDKQRAA
jgi:predicted DNA-binding transcriptional regulator AlpA